MSGDTDPSKVLGYAFSNAPALDAAHLASALDLSGVTAEHTGEQHPIRINVLPREIVMEKPIPTLEQLAAQRIAELHLAGTPHGDQFREDNKHLLK